MNGSRAAAAAGQRRSGAGTRARAMMRALPLALGAALLAACSTPASYAVRISYLQKMARQGVQANHLLKGESVAITRKQCTSSYVALQDPNPPDDQGDEQPPSAAWLGEIRLFYVQSCITGLPKPVPGQAGPARASTPSPSGSASGAAR
jgi:hypothetical protein